MRRAALAAAAIALACAGAAALAGQKLGEPLGQRPPEVLYSQTCAYCHGSNVGPVIRGRQLPAEQVAAIVRQGRNAMPAFRPTEISRAELDVLAAWIEASKADPAEKGK
jgi:mono/diheme cytochrome c family protein